MIVWATTQVAALATSAAPTPTHIGRRRRRCAPLKLAISAARISTASRPSRKTMMAVFVITVVRLFGPGADGLLGLAQRAVEARRGWRRSRPARRGR